MVNSGCALVHHHAIEKKLEEVWENEKYCGDTSRKRVFTAFSCLPNFHDNMFSISFRKRRDGKEENDLLLLRH